MKGAANVFLFRLFQFLRLRRGKLEIARWVAKYSLMKKRITDAWNDLLQPLDRNDAAYAELVREGRRVMGDQFPAEEDEQYIMIVERRRADHAAKFPFNDNLFTLIFIVHSDLTEQMRTTLITNLAIRQILSLIHI